MFQALGPLLSVLFLFWSEPHVLVIEKLDLSCNLCQNCCSSGRSRGRCLGSLAPPLVLDQNEARSSEKNIFETGPPPYLRVWMARSPRPLIWRSGSATVQYWFSLDETLVSRDEMLISGMRHLSFEKWDEIGTCNILLSSRTAFTVSSTVKGWDSLGTENWQISVKIVLSYANVAFFTV